MYSSDLINIDRRFIFSPTYSAWNTLAGYLGEQYLKASEPSSSRITTITNTAKKTLIVLAFAVATLATGIFSVLSFPYRFYIGWQVEKEGFKNDIMLLNDGQQAQIRKEIATYIKENQLDSSLVDDNKSFNRLLASYARSHQVYGPIVRNWIEHLFEKANRENGKLVFMARDGIVPYKMAKKLMALPEYREKYPKLAKENRIVLGYFSRKIIHGSTQSDKNRELFKEYVDRELGIKEGDRCYFVDVGFTGSMIDSIKGLLTSVKIEFEYLISFSEKAKGFLATREKRLSSVPSAGNHFGIHWLEDTHQGNLESPSRLVKVNGRIYPNTKVPGKKTYCTSPGSLDFLVRKFSQRGAVRAYQQPLLSESELIEARERFSNTLEKIKNNLIPLFVRH